MGLSVEGLVVGLRVEGLGCGVHSAEFGGSEKQFQGGLEFKARRLLYHSTLGRE